MNACARLGVAERREAAPHLVEVGARRACPSERRNAPTAPPALSTPFDASSGSTHSAPGQRRGAQEDADLAAEPAARDQHQPLGHLRELVGQLHRDAAAERVADDRRAVVADRAHQVADAAGVGAERVVAARLGGVAVAEQVRRDHRVAVGQERDHVVPRLRAAGDPVDQQDRAAPALAPVRHAVSVQRYLFDVTSDLRRSRALLCDSSRPGYDS